MEAKTRIAPRIDGSVPSCVSAGEEVEFIVDLYYEEKTFYKFPMRYSALHLLNQEIPSSKFSPLRWTGNTDGNSIVFEGQRVKVRRPPDGRDTVKSEIRVTFWPNKVVNGVPNGVCSTVTVSCPIEYKFEDKCQCKKFFLKLTEATIDNFETQFSMFNIVTRTEFGDSTLFPSKWSGDFTRNYSFDIRPTFSEPFSSNFDSIEFFARKIEPNACDANNPNNNHEFVSAENPPSKGKITIATEKEYKVCAGDSPGRITSVKQGLTFGFGHTKEDCFVLIKGCAEINTYSSSAANMVSHPNIPGFYPPQIKDPTWTKTASRFNNSSPSVGPFGNNSIPFEYYMGFDKIKGWFKNALQGVGTNIIGETDVEIILDDIPEIRNAIGIANNSVNYIKFRLRVFPTAGLSDQVVNSLIEEFDL
jgi:hypothetical protein